MAGGGAPVAIVIAVVDGLAGTPEFQPLMVPLSAAKRKRAGPELPPDETTKSVPPLKTSPVGPFEKPVSEPGIVTVSGALATTPVTVTIPGSLTGFPNG